MGYCKTATGQIDITPPLTWTEIKNSPCGTRLDSDEAQALTSAYADTRGKNHGNPPLAMRPDMRLPIGFKIWLAFCGLLGLGTFGLLAWAVIRLVNHYT